MLNPNIAISIWNNEVFNKIGQKFNGAVVCSSSASQATMPLEATSSKAMHHIYVANQHSTASDALRLACLFAKIDYWTSAWVWERVSHILLFASIYHDCATRDSEGRKEAKLGQCLTLSAGMWVQTTAICFFVENFSIRISFKISNEDQQAWCICSSSLWGSMLGKYFRPGLEIMIYISREASHQIVHNFVCIFVEKGTISLQIPNSQLLSTIILFTEYHF